jgi:general secretion pathway protein N
VIAAPTDRVALPAPKAAEPERLPLALIGAVVGDGEAIAIFLDRTDQKVIRLRQGRAGAGQGRAGQAHAGWALRCGRAIALQCAEGTAVISAVTGAATVQEGGGQPLLCALRAPLDAKHGEPDGL